MRTNYLYRSGPTMTWPELNMPKFREAMSRALGIDKNKKAVPVRNFTDLTSYQKSTSYTYIADNNLVVRDPSISKKNIARFATVEEVREGILDAYELLMKQAIRDYYDRMINKKSKMITSGKRKDGLSTIKGCGLVFFGTYDECYQHQLDNIDKVSFTEISKKLKFIKKGMPDFKFDIESYSKFVVQTLKLKHNLI